jgi:hypothetical protein
LPITLIVQRVGEDVELDESLRQFKPQPDLQISISKLPRLLVEVNSTLESTSPMDLVRMLVTGAFVVRFANKFVGAFCEKKNFVLCAIFMWDNGSATRYILFQKDDNEKVCCDL